MRILLAFITFTYFLMEKDIVLKIDKYQELIEIKYNYISWSKNEN